MRSSLHSVNALSPESTVTSLLSSSGHLTSSLQPPPLSHSFCYKDKEYDSASAALNAYITDFERSHRSNAPMGAGLMLPPSSHRRAALGTLRNRDVLRERLSERELDFLSLPVSSLRHRSNRDRVSMTTDELLNLPNNGSMPITHTTAFIHGQMSKSGLSHSRSPVKSTCSQSHSRRAGHPIRTLRCPRCGGAERTNRGGQVNTTLQPDLRTTSSSVPPHDWPSGRDQASMHLPHWLCSNKAAVDCWDLHSLPDLPYPPWIQHCHADQSERGYDPGSQLESSYNNQGRSQSGEIEEFPASAPSWILELDEDEQQVDSERSLKSLRLQFAEHISQLASERTDSVDALYRDQRIRSLIQKADRVLDSLQTSATGSPVPPENLDQTKDLLLQDLDQSLSREDQPGPLEPQPGPLEAYKQILFRLQAVESMLHHRQGAPQERPDLQERGQQEAQQQRHRTQESLQGPGLTDQSAEDDGESSLQRALLHLRRLKLLVETPQTEAPLKPLTDQADEEERDEGRYSSSSNERQQGAPQTKGALQT